MAKIKVLGLENAKQISLPDIPCPPQHGALIIINIIITHLLLPIPRLRPLHFSLPVILLKRPRRHLIQPQQRLIRVLNKHILPLLHVPAHINNRPHDTPSISEIQVHLLSELAWVVAYDTEDDVLVGDFG